jgi:hypothetical protein
MSWQERAADPEGQGDAAPWVAGQDYAEPRPAGPHAGPQPAGPWAPGRDYAGRQPAGPQDVPWAAPHDYAEPWAAGQDYAGYWAPGQDEAGPWAPGQDYTGPRAAGRDHESWTAGSGGHPEPWAPGYSGDEPPTVEPGGGWAHAEPWSAGQALPSQPSAGPDHQRRAAQAEYAYQDDWHQAGGDTAEDADYDWYRSLGQGLSTNAKPSAAPAERPPATGKGSARSAQPGSGKAARRADRRLGRRKSSGAVPDPDASARDRTSPGYRRPEHASPAYETHPGMSFPGQADAGVPFAGQTRPGMPFPGQADAGVPFPGQSATSQVPVERMARSQAPATPVPAAPVPAQSVPSNQVTSRPVPSERSAGKEALDRPGRQAARSAARARRGGRSGKHSRWRFAGLAGGAIVLVASGAVVFSARTGGGVAHVMVTPSKLGNYAQAPSLARDMGAAALQKQIVASSSGEAKHVVYAVYEEATGPAAQHGPQIILFIGGNRSGTSASSFMTSFAGKLEGAATTSAGSMGGAAACVPSVGGRLAECAWADNDTFGVIASPTLSASALASELRTVRPLVEKRAG